MVLRGGDLDEGLSGSPEKLMIMAKMIDRSK